MGREKIRRVLTEDEGLASRIEQSRQIDGKGNLVWQPEVERVRKVLLKLARGHLAYELHPDIGGAEVFFAPLLTLTASELTAFEDAPVRSLEIWPEIGT